MAGVTATVVCPVCGEEYWYDFDTRTGETTKLSSCACDRELDYLREFIRMRGLEDEFGEFRKERERERWYDWIVEKVSDASEPEEFLESLERHVEEIKLYLSNDDVLEAVAEGLKASGCEPQELDELISKLAELLGESKDTVKREILKCVI